MATANTSSSNPRAEKMADVLVALSSGTSKTAAFEPKLEPQLLAPEFKAELVRQLLTELQVRLTRRDPCRSCPASGPATVCPRRRHNARRHEPSWWTTRITSEVTMSSMFNPPHIGLTLRSLASTGRSEGQQDPLGHQGTKASNGMKR